MLFHESIHPLPGFTACGCCDAGTNPIPAANRLMANEYRLTPKPTVRLPANPTWRENPFHDNLWQFHYHSLVYVLQLEGAKPRDSDLQHQTGPLARVLPAGLGGRSGCVGSAALAGVQQVGAVRH